MLLSLQGALYTVFPNTHHLERSIRNPGGGLGRADIGHAERQQPEPAENRDVGSGQRRDRSTQSCIFRLSSVDMFLKFMHMHKLQVEPQKCGTF